MKYKINKYVIDAKSPEEALKIVKLLDGQVKDEASIRSTIESLIAEEQSAVDSYNVALKNLDGKLDETQIEAIKAIRDDEQRHIENLYAVLGNNVTEKNLES